MTFGSFDIANENRRASGSEIATSPSTTILNEAFRSVDGSLIVVSKQLRKDKMQIDRLMELPIDGAIIETRRMIRRRF